jgi:hypothetical protein
MATVNWARNSAGIFSPSGTFVCPDQLDEIYDVSHIPVGWSVKKPSDSYIQDGLVFQLDINRYKEQSSWKDMKGGVSFTKRPDKDIFEAVALNFPTTYTIEIASYSQLNNSVYNSAILYSGIDTATLQVGLFLIDGVTTLGILTYNGYYQGGNVLTDTDGNTFNFPTNGLSSISANGQNIWIDNHHIVLPYSLYHENKDISVVGDTKYIKSIRVYNRVLTAEERTHNEKVDISRFGNNV